MHCLTNLDGWRLAEGKRWEYDAETLVRMVNSKFDYN